MTITSELENVSDDDLLRRLAQLVGESRRVEAVLVAHIGEVDARRLYIRAAPSMFAYCTAVLHLSEHEAYARITVARAARRYPELLAMLGDGRLHLSGIAKLAAHVTAENCSQLLARATHKTKAEIEALIAEIAPKPDVAAAIRRIPVRGEASSVGELGLDRAAGTGVTRELGLDRVAGTGAAHELGLDRVAGTGTAHELSLDRVAGTGTAHELGLDRVADTDAARELGLDRVAGAAAGSSLARSASRADAASRPAAVTPLSPERYKVQFTASAELRQKLERLQALTRSDLVSVIEAAVTEKLARLEAKRFGLTAAPRKSLAETDTLPCSRYLPAAVRRAVRRRDGEQCSFVLLDGSRCPERFGLEFHHRHPYGRGGTHEPDNVCLMCRQHNGYAAEVDYGKERIEKYRRGADHVSEGTAVYGTAPLARHQVGDVTLQQVSVDVREATYAFLESLIFDPEHDEIIVQGSDSPDADRAVLPYWHTLAARGLNPRINREYRIRPIPTSRSFGGLSEGRYPYSLDV
jgi:hypothetical protein